MAAMAPPPALLVQVPNAGVKAVAAPAGLASRGAAEVHDAVQAAVCAALEWPSADGVRVLFQEQDLANDAAASALVQAFGAGQPCILRVAVDLLGGKGGFGALLRKQMGLGKKTTNFDAMRDLSGRRLRHSKAVDRIKTWMEEKKRQDELVDLLTGEGPELPKPTPESESLDPDFVARMKRAEALQPALVNEGMRRLEGEGGGAASSGAASSSSVSGAGGGAGGSSSGGAGSVAGGAGGASGGGASAVADAAGPAAKRRRVEEADGAAGAPRGEAPRGGGLAGGGMDALGMLSSDSDEASGGSAPPSPAAPAPGAASSSGSAAGAA